jgi:hypothetical protein
VKREGGVGVLGIQFVFWVKKKEKPKLSKNQWFWGCFCSLGIVIINYWTQAFFDT